MSYNPIISLLQGIYTTVDVRFENPGKLYTYKTRLSLIRGDKVVVFARDIFQVVEVVNVHTAPKIDYAATFEYKWIVQKLDTSTYDKVLEEEAELQTHLDIADRLRQRQAIMEVLEKTYPEDSKSRSYWLTKIKPLLKD